MNLSEEDKLAFSRRCPEHEAGYTMQFASPTSPNIQVRKNLQLIIDMNTDYNIFTWESWN